MKRAVNTKPFNKTILSGAISAVLSVGLSVPLVAQADIYEFTFDNGGCSGNPVIACAGPGDGVFTILDGTNKTFGNTSEPYYSDLTWGKGGSKRTQIGGSITVKETDGAVQGKGVATINPFEFFNGGPAAAKDITFEDIGDGSGTLGTVGAAGEKLWLSQMLFDWNGSNGIPVSLAWDLQGLLNNLPGLDINNIANPGNVIGSEAGDLTGTAGIEPGSDGINKGKYAIGPSPVATTTFDTTPLCDTNDSNTYPINPPPNPGFPCLTTNPSGALPLVPDATSIGGSPMIDGPFAGANANFDVAKLTLSGYNDTTAPVVTLGSTVLNLNVNDAFDENNPGVSVTCADSADGNDDLTVLGNTNISFTVDNGNGGNTLPVDTSTAGNYEVLYTCTDNASARAAITSDPDNPGTPTLPADNTSDNTTILTVSVAAVGAPVITITNGTPTAHEACTLYNDAGATAVNAGGVSIGPVVVTDNDIIIGNIPNEINATIDYDITDNGTPAITQIRTVNVTDSLPPVITIPGGAAVTIESKEQPTYTNPAATAVDANNNCNKPPGGVAATPDTVNFVIPAGQDSLDSTLRYFASDISAAANQTQQDQVVTVVRSEPVITLIGGGVSIGLGVPYVEPGMDIHDVQDGDLNAITTSGMQAGAGGTGGTGTGILSYTIDASAVDVNVPNTYDVIYDVTDGDAPGNAATQVIRKVTVGAAGAGSNFTMLDSTGKRDGGTNDVLMQWDNQTNTDENDLAFDAHMAIATLLPQPYSNFFWTAHHIRVFGPGNYSFDASCSAAQYDAGQTANCGGTKVITMTVPAGHVGGHILFDWGKPDTNSPCGVKSCDIDVVNVWQIDSQWDRHGAAGASVVNSLWNGLAGLNPDPNATWTLVSTDVTGYTIPDNQGGGFSVAGNNINGAPMVDGPFEGFNANFNQSPDATIGAAPPVFATQPDTTLSSMNIAGLLASVLSLFGLRRFTRKK